MLVVAGALKRSDRGRPEDQVNFSQLTGTRRACRYSVNVFPLLDSFHLNCLYWFTVFVCLFVCLLLLFFLGGAITFYDSLQTDCLFLRCMSLKYVLRYAKKIHTKNTHTQDILLLKAQGKLWSDSLCRFRTDFRDWKIN